MKLSVLASGWGTLKDERILHDRFAAHRLHGEWFERHPDILAEVERLSPHTPRGVSA
nr:GIY-YIG nuclease family protein [Sphingopyxis witflariensis]